MAGLWAGSLVLTSVQNAPTRLGLVALTLRKECAALTRVPREPFSDYSAEC